MSPKIDASKINDFTQSKLVKGFAENLATLESDIRQPDRFAQIFCEAAKTQKSIDCTLRDILINLLQKDSSAQEAITSIVEGVDRSYGRLLMGKAGWAIWAIIGMVIEAVIQYYWR